MIGTIIILSLARVHRGEVLIPARYAREKVSW